MPPDSAPFFRSVPVAVLTGAEGEQWDVAVIVKYVGIGAFRDMVESEGYKERCVGHKIAGLEDDRLIILDRVEE